MRDELTDDEWTAISPMVPNKPRGVSTRERRRVLNGIFWVLRSQHHGARCPMTSVRTPRATTALLWRRTAASGAVTRRPISTLEINADAKIKSLTSDSLKQDFEQW
jgi:transposase